MTDMRVKLILDMTNRMSQPAKAAQRDLKGVAGEARKLDRQKTGTAASAGLARTAKGAETAGAGLRRVGEAARQFDRQRTGTRVGEDLNRVRRQAEETARALGRARDARGRFLATGRMLGHGGGGGVGSGAGAPAAGGGMAGAATAAVAASTRAALAPVGAAFGVYGAARGTVGTAISRDKAMAEVRKKVDLPEGESFDRLERQMTAMSIALGRSFEDVAAITAEAAAAGVAYKDLAGFTMLATKASIAWDMSASDAAQKLFEIRAATGKALPALERFGDLINHLGDNSAAKERDLLEMANRAMAAAKESNVPEETSLAFLTAMRSVGIQPEIGARGFNALVSTMITADDSEKVAEGLKLIGLNAKEMAAAMKKDATKALLDLFTALERSKDPVKAAVKIFGKEWFDEMLRTKGTMSEVKRLLEMVSKPATYSGSMTKNLNVELATTANHLKRLQSLTSDVGNRLGQWALPGINEGIQRIIDGLNELDRRTAAREAAERTGAALDAGTPLTPEQRRRMAEDAGFRKDAEGRAKGIAESRRDATTTNRARLSELLDERERLTASLANRKAFGADESQLAVSRERLNRLEAEIGGIDPSLKKRDGRRPADQDDRALWDGRREEAEALKLRLGLLEARLKTYEDLARAARDPRDREGFLADSEDLRRRVGSIYNTWLRQIAPNVAGVNRFGFSQGGAPASPTPGIGRMGFGLGGPATAGKGVDWAKAAKATEEELKAALLTIDLGPSARMLAEKLADGMKAGAPAASDAGQALGEAARAGAASVSLFEDGKRAADSYAAGVRSGAPAVKAAIAGLGGQTVSPRARLDGALSDAGRP